MLVSFTNKILEERNKLIDKLTMELIKKVGIPIEENYTNFDLLMVMQDLKSQNYEIVLKKSYNDKEWLALYKDNALVYAYELDVKMVGNKVIISTIPIE